MAEAIQLPDLFPLKGAAVVVHAEEDQQIGDGHWGRRLAEGPRDGLREVCIHRLCFR
eukprot:CAMPEP_0184229252 /NCGR_PEP_ID=MMETSP0976-20121227/22170_1 /TAXON_ID=483370 /ORGANISM="non described non described, Strain CCMP2097" /LENGTH=56 /DNA_ID=CAMNT_0026534223 /DNA_START=164 /DNA_END=330 /DNA_ORIENTATION=-